MIRYFLDRNEDVRAALKGIGVGAPVHLHDQALFDIIETMKRYVESGGKQTHVKAKVRTRFGRAERHDAFWPQRSYDRMGFALGGQTTEPDFGRFRRRSEGFRP